jgi:hypothetical protein
MLNAERRETLSTFWKCNEQVPVHGKQPIPMLSGSPGHMGDSVGSASVHTSSPSRAAYPSGEDGTHTLVTVECVRGCGEQLEMSCGGEALA